MWHDDRARVGVRGCFDSGDSELAVFGFGLDLFNSFFSLLHGESVDLGLNCFDDFIYNASYLTCTIRSCPELLCCITEVRELSSAHEFAWTIIALLRRGIAVRSKGAAYAAQSS
jgi:hypothetical protein